MRAFYLYSFFIYWPKSDALIFVLLQLVKRKVGAVVVVIKQEVEVEDGDHLVQVIRRTKLKEVAGRSQDGNNR